jgi:hypothetical protein
MVDFSCDNLTVNQKSKMLGDMNVDGNVMIGHFQMYGKTGEFDTYYPGSGGYYFSRFAAGDGKILLFKKGHNTETITFDADAGDISLPGSDCAEDFEISSAEQVDPGTVMALNDEGKLVQGKQPYDKRVAGVISGAGDLKPGLVLGRRVGHADRVPLALIGRVNCKVDADYESIEVGDLLTRSATLGHAMKASDPTKSFGSVIGKALRPLKAGCDLIQILVALQ